MTRLELPVTEPRPPDVLDEALDVPPGHATLAAIGAVVAAAALVTLVGTVGFGSLAALPSSSASLLPSPMASSPAAPTEPSPTSCDELAAPAGGGGIVLVYFPCGGVPGSEPVAAARSISDELSGIERLRVAIHALLDGPTAAETSAGLTGVVPAGSAGLLEDVELAPDGLATVDFDRALTDVNNLSTPAAGGALLAAVRATALDLDDVTGVELRLGGSCAAFFEHFGSTCEHLTEPVADPEGCRIIPPASLPSGAPAGEPRPYPREPMVTWGSGDDTVTQRAAPDDRLEPPADETTASVRGYPAAVRPSGDLPVPSGFEIAWREYGCLYRVFIATAGGEAAALAFAEAYSPTVAQPSASPSRPVTVEAEQDGLRLTLTLDRDTTVWGQRVMATGTIENVGPETVYWGHSGTCAFPIDVIAHPPDGAVLRPGRDDWTGDAAVLKELATYDAGRALPFVPDQWLDFEGMWGCTSDLQVSELAPGTALTHVAGWDTVAAFEMPPPPGEYRVRATFHYMSRGGVPVDERADEFRLEVTVPLRIDGDATEGPHPGEVVDSLLEDPRFVSALADAPRELWRQVTLSYVAGTWELVLHLSDGDTSPDDALVGIVDAASGDVLDVLREPRTRPQGG